MGSLNLIVPESSGAPWVRRYAIEDARRTPAPLEVYAGWWVCVERGEVLARPIDPSEYGRLRIESIVIDQSTGERGQE